MRHNLNPRKCETDKNLRTHTDSSFVLFYLFLSKYVRWVVHEALSAIGLSSTEAAASTLLTEGLRRCAVLLGVGGGDGGSDAAGSLLSGTTSPTRSEPHRGADGWDFSDVDEDEWEEKLEASGGGGSDDVCQLRARLLALQGLVETHVVAEGAQGRGFDAMRLRFFLSLGRVSPGTAGGGDKTFPVEVGDLALAGETAWEDCDRRRTLLETAAMAFAAKGETSALGVLFKRYPQETLPIRLQVLRWDENREGALS